MEWKDIGKIIGKSAPIVGSLFGPAGSAIGGIVASLLGVEDKPDKVAEALKNNPDALVKLKQYEMEHEAKLKQMQLDLAHAQMLKDTKDLETINATIRAELGQEDKYTKRWRPTMGYAVTFSWVTVWLAVVYTIVFNTNKAQEVILALTQTTTLWSVALAVLGIYVYKRSDDKSLIAGVTNTAKNVLQPITRKVNDKIKPVTEEKF